MRTTKTILCILSTSLAFASTANADDVDFKANLSTAQEIPTPGPGLIRSAKVKAEFDRTFSDVEVELKVEGGANVVAAHFHCALPGVIGPVAFGLFSPGPLAYDGREAEGVLTNADSTGADCVSMIGRPVNNIAPLVLAMEQGLSYINVHTTDNLPGEVRGPMR